MEEKNKGDFDIPLLKVSGKNYGEIGQRVGAEFKDRIALAYANRKKWIDRLVAFGEEDRASRIDPFVRAIKEEFPHIWEEIEGLALGSEWPLDHMVAVILNPELTAMMKAESAEEDCTTVAVASGEKLWIGHNEDGSCHYHDSMYMLDIGWPSGRRSLALSYPGYLPGNGPSINSAVVQTLNYIGASEVKPGIPRYVIDRAVMEAEDLDHAIRLAVHPRRAYSQHHTIMGIKEKRIVSVESGPVGHSLLQVDGMYGHANHFVHPAMRDTAQIDTYGGSSGPRQEAADNWTKRTDPDEVTEDDVMTFLRGHEQMPHSVCRHLEDNVPGCTLASIFIGLGSGTIRVYAGEPCGFRFRDFAWPSPA